MSAPHVQSGVSGEDWARADFYALLSKLYSGRIDEQFIKSFKQLDKSSIDITSPLGFEFMELIRAIEQTEPKAIIQEFDDLFIGVGRPDVMLFGSYYLAGFLNEKPLVALRDDLRRIGLEADKTLTETEDHMAFLCEVMRFLILEENPPLPFDEQVRFFTQHVAPWYARLCDAIEANPKANFFKTVGRL
ncbi:MAG: molecular chaperone TorD family protein, partial [Limnobacter sp.]|nr:molecular chaperone TorD family protein [Limnobacter sp.]